MFALLSMPAIAQRGWPILTMAPAAGAVVFSAVALNNYVQDAKDPKSANSTNALYKPSVVPLHTGLRAATVGLNSMVVAGLVPVIALARKVEYECARKILLTIETSLGFLGILLFVRTFDYNNPNAGDIGALTMAGCTLIANLGYVGSCAFQCCVL